jgi:23S rRNA (guanine745-N1)-methyltransferase
MTNQAAFWACPNCSLPLISTDSGYACDKGHSFDRAKQGYCNFLLANQKSTKEPGDNQNMIDARRAFLQGAYYDFLVNKVAECFFKYNQGPRVSDFSILDMGCGEGYYLNKVSQLIAARFKQDAEHDDGKEGLVRAWGIDISKVANRRAAALYKEAHFAVASTFNMPVISDVVDLAFCVFAPLAESEVRRVLNKEQGLFIRVFPGPRHLYQIKQAIYDKVNLHESPEVADGFELLEQVHVHQQLRFTDTEDLNRLMSMTPLNWHGRVDAKQALLNQPNPCVEADFIIQVLKCA